MFYLQVPDINGTIGVASEIAANPLLSGINLIIIGVILIIATVLVLYFLKKIIINTVLGAIVWAIIVFGFSVKLPLIPSLAVAVIFGPAGLGVLLVLKFLGVF